MMDVIGGINILERLFKAARYFRRQYRRNPYHYLEGSLNSGLDIAYRIIALFEAHGVKKTQIYRLLGERFSEIKPSLEAQQLQTILNGDLINAVSELFGVRKAWVEGEGGRIYEPLCHYKDLPAFEKFVSELRSRNSDKYCYFTALKPSSASEDLYQDHPPVALFFSEKVADIDGKGIDRHFPIYGPLPWDHSFALYHLAAFFNIVYATPGFVLKGCMVVAEHVDKVSDGSAIPMYKAKLTDIWHPEDYAYPLGYFNGRLKIADWQEMIEYFAKRGECSFLKNVEDKNCTFWAD
jgi:hypothetical protein